MNSIGQNIKSAREFRKLTQEELAQKMRIGTQMIEKYESGDQIPSSQTLLKFSTILDIPTSELLKEEELHTASPKVQ